MSFVNREIMITFADITRTLANTYTHQEARTEQLNNKWYSSIPRRVNRENRQRFYTLTDQFYLGNPALIGKNWTKNHRDWTKVPRGTWLVDFNHLVNQSNNFLDIPNTNAWWDATTDVFDRHWVSGDTILTNNGGQLVNASMQWGQPISQVVNYHYHTIGRYRGARGTTEWDVTNKHIVVNTDKAVLPIEDGLHAADGERILLYDNDVGLWRVKGNGGYLTFNHLHPFSRTTWHDDFHRGHWVRAFEINGTNNCVMFNFHANMDWNGTLANDTSGPYFRIEGSNNLLIVNVFDGITAHLRGKMGDAFMEVSNWNNQLIIINHFGSGVVKPKRDYNQWLTLAGSRWKQ